MPKAAKACRRWRFRHAISTSYFSSASSRSTSCIRLHVLVHRMQVGNNSAFDCREETERQPDRRQVVWPREHGIAQPYAFVGISQSRSTA
jgi:hypothetical protein